jgi:hypothetical protein
MEDILRANAPHNSESRQNKSLCDIAHLHPVAKPKIFAIWPKP